MPRTLGKSIIVMVILTDWIALIVNQWQESHGYCLILIRVALFGSCPHLTLPISGMWRLRALGSSHAAKPVSFNNVLCTRPGDDLFWNLILEATPDKGVDVVDVSMFSPSSFFVRIGRLRGTECAWTSGPACPRIIYYSGSKITRNLLAVMSQCFVRSNYHFSTSPSCNLCFLTSYHHILGVQ